ncbi:hypothetical protein [Limnoglobus roseus]|uniref:Uncharacterized protein n=1 Tax=Limnoglobus roseus TaxID=2598579 RepID=A0A5C1A8Q1_9BACT|nr:hypothetical protein [Limnoglobus roseus]QEL15709.1 hypothetical protein PX52LOC_02644 [Limnoglobus roseus]
MKRASFLAAGVVMAFSGVLAAQNHGGGPIPPNGAEQTPVDREFYLPPPDNNVFPLPMARPEPKTFGDDVRDTVNSVLRAWVKAL